LLVLVGCRILLSDPAAAMVWSLLAIACIGAGGRWGRLTLEVHGGIYLLLALAFSGALREAGGFLVGTDFWLGWTHAALWSGAAVGGACYLLAVRSAPSISGGWNFRALRVALASVLVWEVLGLSAGTLTSVYHGLIGATAGDPFCATIRTGVVEGALTVPKETLRHDAVGDYVFLLKGGAIELRRVKTGNSSVTRIQVTEGLAEGDAVAMPSDTPLKPGMMVTAAFEGRP